MNEIVPEEKCELKNVCQENGNGRKRRQRFKRDFGDKLERQPKRKRLRVVKRRRPVARRIEAPTTPSSQPSLISRAPPPAIKFEVNNSEEETASQKPTVLGGTVTLPPLIPEQRYIDAQLPRSFIYYFAKVFFKSSLKKINFGTEILHWNFEKLPGNY